MASLIDAKRAWTEQVLPDVETAVAMLIEEHPLLWKLPRQDKANAASSAARHLLLAIRAKSVSEMVEDIAGFF